MFVHFNFAQVGVNPQKAVGISKHGLSRPAGTGSLISSHQASHERTISVAIASAV
jgi:hypothetical protein